MTLKLKHLFATLTILLAACSFSRGETRVSLLTCGPGAEVYTLEGHSALRLQTDDGRDITVNWGMFDFNDPGFVGKFLKGRTDYWAGACPTPYFLAEYRAEGRQVVEQTLNLSPEQTAALVNLIETNLLPQNREYRYRYLSDNCATRPLALIEQAVNSTGDTLRVNPPVSREATTYRSALAGYHRQNRLYQLFIDIALGRKADSAITDRQRAFAPLYLSRMLSRIDIVDPQTGAFTSLSPDEPVTLLVQQPDAMKSEPSPWLFIGPLIGLALIAMIWQQRCHRVLRWANAIFFLLYGLVGCLVALLMFWSEQEATGGNLNILWLNPVALIVPILVWSRRGRSVIDWYVMLNILAILLFVILSYFGHQPSFEILGLLLADLMMSAGYVWGHKYYND